MIFPAVPCEQLLISAMQSIGPLPASMIHHVKLYTPCVLYSVTPAITLFRYQTRKAHYLLTDADIKDFLEL